MIRTPYKILRAFIVTAILLAVVIPVTLYVVLSLPAVQHRIRDIAQRELADYLGTRVEIGRVGISPFSSVTLTDVVVCDSLGIEALQVDRLGTGVDLWELIGGDIVIDYVELIGMDAHLYKATPESELNIASIIRRIAPEKKSDEPSRFRLAVNTVVVRKSSLRYDVNSKPYPDDSHFSSDHIAVSGLCADITMPVLSDSHNVIDIRRLAFMERSGLVIDALEGRVEFTPSSFEVTGLNIRMPGSSFGLRDILYEFGSVDKLKSTWRTSEFNIGLREGSYLRLSDFAPFYGPLASMGSRVDLQIEASGSPSDFDVTAVIGSIGDIPLNLSFGARIEDILDGINAVKVTIPDFNLNFDGLTIPDFIKPLVSLSAPLTRVFGVLGRTIVSGEGFLTLDNIFLKGNIDSACGDVALEMTADRKKKRVNGSVESSQIDLTGIIPDMKISAEGLSADFDISAEDGEATIVAQQLAVRDARFENIEANAALHDKIAAITAKFNGNVGVVDARADIDMSTDNPHLALDATVSRLNPEPFGVKMPTSYAGYTFHGIVSAEISGRDADSVDGYISFKEFEFESHNNGQPSLAIDNIDITSSHDENGGRRITLNGGGLDAVVTGKFKIADIIPTFRTIISHINPEFFAESDGEDFKTDDDVNFKLSVDHESPLVGFFRLPVQPLSPVTLLASMDGLSETASLSVNAPYLRQNNKLIENTSLNLSLDGIERRSRLEAYTLFPAKGGMVGLNVSSNGHDGLHDSEISWSNRSGRNHGNFRFSTGFERSENGLFTDINVNPAEIVFGDTVWTVRPSVIMLSRDMIDVDHFEVFRDDQSLSIDGTASKDSDDKLILVLNDINLDYVFETLNISSNVMFGGDATGTVYASQLFSGKPVLFTPGLSVKNLAYNGCVMGDGLIRSEWLADEGAVTINAVISQKNGYSSRIDGKIVPVGERLDFTFDADHANIGFLKPFMAAFCDGISGEASGHAHLFGTFKLLDMEGDLFAHDMKMDLGLTGVSYWATDSVKIRPGCIELKDIELHDMYGKTAILSGILTHESFHDPVFEFEISEARDLLCYNIGENLEHPWYGRIFGTGSASVKGRPGLVDINVDMATAAGSEFTFVLTDTENAADYDFLTFRDVTPPSQKDYKNEPDTIPELVRELRDMTAQKASERPSDYHMTFNVDVTPSAQMTLVMDPVGGDRIRATGSGNLRMSYGSANEDLKMYGIYTLNRGFYNFTLQDIIIKDFTIENGSSIAFHGDPYSAQLDIRAYYSLNANLSDLDESFLQDRDLNRTNVPVHAMLLVDGDMRSPEISFDLEFPTLTRDTYRKVRSIVSTDDMMNRQIIYLLALNRFYTPEYMSATKGNELVSVASSTISSQLSSMLGQLSDKFSIAPSFRSDRGDFSDVEVDVALSSHLLNNRLLLNGNFGYRDKSLNNNSFIGDFDIEYLLNRSGSIRLKAYNRYNDQNYYLKSALTTQGVGVVFRRDFDNVFSFLKPFRRKKKNSEKTDTVVSSEEK